MKVQTTAVLGPATVTAFENGRALLERPGWKGWAQVATTLPYRPEAGDVVLAIGEDPAWIIGLIHGRGATVIETPGDIELRAGGKITLTSATALEAAAPEVSIQADRLETAARDAFERFTSCYRWVKGLFQVSSGRSRQLVDGAHTLQADRIEETAKRDVRIDGQSIHLG